MTSRGMNNKSVFLLALIPLLVLAPTLSFAALDDKSFQICWNKMLSKTGISSDVMEPLKAPTEKDVLAGNLTYGAGVPDALKALAAPFKENIYNCMMMVTK